MMLSSVFVSFPYGVSGQVWYFIVSIPDLAFFFTITGSLNILQFVVSYFVQNILKRIACTQHSIIKGVLYKTVKLQSILILSTMVYPCTCPYQIRKCPRYQYDTKVILRYRYYKHHFMFGRRQAIGVEKYKW